MARVRDPSASNTLGQMRVHGCREHIMTTRRIPLKVVTAPTIGVVLDAPPVLRASEHSVDYTCGRCAAILLHADEGQVHGIPNPLHKRRLVQLDRYLSLQTETLLTPMPANPLAGPDGACSPQPADLLAVLIDRPVGEVSEAPLRADRSAVG